MNSWTDQELLREYSALGSEAAFAELVRRHLDPVYSAALRMVCDAHLAEDVAQGVFLALAQNARQLADRAVLSGWLHRTAENLAANTVRSTVRRRAREQEAAAMSHSLSAETDAPWEDIAPHLDAALGELEDTDRDALLLRYFERKSAQAMAQVLGISDVAAQKRVSRAVDRLREIFAKRGVTVSANGLIVLISTHVVLVAPAGLSATIIASALTGTTVAASGTGGATGHLAMTTLPKALIVAAFVAVLSITIYQARRASALQEQVGTLKQQQSALAEQLANERDEVLRQRVVRESASDRDRNMEELLRLRGEVARLRRATQEVARLSANRGQPTNTPLTVAAIVVTNLEPRVLTEDQIRANIQVKVGDIYRRLAIDEDMRAIYATGFFSYTRVTESTNELGITLTYVVKERGELANVGTATPEAAFQTFLWVAKHGDSNLLSHMLGWRKEREDAVSDDLASQVTAAQARSVVNTFSNLAGIRILGQLAETPGTTRMRVEFRENNGRTHLGEIYMLREGSFWKPALTFSRREGSTTVSSQFLLPTTQELGPEN